MNEADRIHAAIGVLSDQISGVHAEIQGDSVRTQAIVRDAVSAGIRDVLSDEKVVAQFWRAALSQVQEHAQREAGSIVLGGLRKGLTVAVFVAFAYSVGGFTMAKQAWHWMTT